MERTNGINEEKVDKLITDIYYYSEKAHQIFMQAEEVMNDSLNNYQSESTIFLKQYIELLKKKMRVLDKNILTYVDDMNNLKKNMAFRDNLLSENFNTSKFDNKKGVYKEYNI